MKTVFIYFLQVIICSGILYGYYHIALRNKKFHQYNRYYLLAATVISILIPFINIPVYFSTNDQPSLFTQTLAIISSPGKASAETIPGVTATTVSFFNWQNLSLIFYALIGCLVFFRFALGLYRIKKMISKNVAEKVDHIYFVNTAEPGTPFSFFSWMFWNKKIELQSENGQQIFRHELFHIRQKHTWDIIFMEILTVVFWINPFYHLIKKELKTIHEFLADQFAVQENDKWNYAELLLRHVLQSPNSRLTNPFFHNQVKRRIAMITSSKKPGYQYLRKVMVLPLAALVVALFAFSYKTRHEFKHSTLKKPVTVVIDAGNSQSTEETKIMLAIAKKIKTLNEDEKITIILEPSDKNVSLQQRVAFINQQHPDMVISLQSSLDGDIKDDPNGAEIYFAGKNHKFYTENRILGLVFSIKLVWSGFERRLKSDENSNAELLRKSNCPALIIGCGHISNPRDLAFMKQPENIATIIINAIQEYASLKESDRWNKLFREYSGTTEADIKLSRDPVSKKITGTYDGKPIKKFWLVKHRGHINAGYMLYCFVEENENMGPYIVSQEMSDNLLRQYPELRQQVERTIDQTKEKEEVSDRIITDTAIEIHEVDLRDTVKPPSNILMNGNISLIPPPAKNYATAELLKEWQNSKIYGVWIDENRINNADLNNYKPSDFLHYDVSKLSKNAVNYGKHYYQVGLMTKKYYYKIIKEWDYSPHFTGSVIVKDTSPLAVKQIENYLIVIDGKIKDKAALQSLNVENIKSINVVKDQAAITRYGDKGKNGVVEIYTKQKDVIVEERIFRDSTKAQATEVRPEDVKQDETDNIIFEKAEIEPTFPGGQTAWRKFLEKNLNAAIPLDHKAPPGTYTVWIKFIIDKEGNTSDPKALTKMGYGMEEEAIRVVKLSDKWVPAIQNGHKVKAYKKQPISFVVAR